MASSSHGLLGAPGMDCSPASWLAHGRAEARPGQSPTTVPALAGKPFVTVLPGDDTRFHPAEISASAYGPHPATKRGPMRGWIKVRQPLALRERSRCEGPGEGVAEAGSFHPASAMPSPAARTLPLPKRERLFLRRYLLRQRDELGLARHRLEPARTSNRPSPPRSDRGREDTKFHQM